MTKLAIMTLCLTLAPLSFAGNKPRCKKHYSPVSCKEVKDSKRSGFCWKGKIGDEKRDKICKSLPKKKLTKRKAKKMVKKGS